MRSLLPLLRLVLRYRSTLVISVVCSLLVGVLWGANIGALYPVLNVVFKGESLEKTVLQRVEESEEEWRQAKDVVSQLERQLSQADSGESEQLEWKLHDEQTRLVAKHRAYVGWQWAGEVLSRCWPSGPFATLVLVVVLVMIGTILRGVFQVANEILVSRLTQRVLFKLRVTFYRRTLNLDMATLASDRTSRLMSRFTNDMMRINEGLNALLGQSVREPMKILMCLIGAAFVSWRLLLIALLVAPPTVLVLRFLIGSLRRASNASMAAMPQLYAQLERSFAGIKLVKTSNMERMERNRFRGICRSILERIQRVSKYRAMIRPATEVMSIGGVSLAVLAGAYLVIHQKTHLLGIRITDNPLQPATLMLFYAFLMGASEPLKKLAGAIVSVQRTSVANQRIQQMMSRVPTVTDPPHPVPLPEATSDLLIENVHFAYPGGAQVLKGVDLAFHAGEMVAIIGPNGSGKTTLVHLIPRLYDLKDGQIRLAGIDIRDVRIRELRRRIAMVPQETLLFDDTVFNNIRYGAVQATEEEVFEASCLAQAHEFVTTKLEDGYETMVGERGCFLSGGQRQRIALARALLRNPKILILDEATSEIDAASEKMIYRAIKGNAQDRITILIAHGMSILEIADRVVMLDDGVVQAVGTHAELLSNSPCYKQLFQRNIRPAA
jgi:ATP-binding cassette subfamily B protein/subfamily B ATP-binding cassette protein MsbA